MNLGRPYKFTAAKESQIRKLHGAETLFCFKCTKSLKVGQIVRRGGAKSKRWYHNKCFEKTRQ